MSVIMSGLILIIVMMAGEQVTATQTCQYSYSCTGGSGGCSYDTRTCDDICCDDKSKGYDDICCRSSSYTGTIAGSVVGGIVIFVIVVLCCCACSNGNKVQSLR